jgi:hypothetical protein
MVITTAGASSSAVYGSAMRIVGFVAVALIVACSSSENRPDNGQDSGEAEAATDSATALDSVAATDALPEIKLDTENKTVFVTSTTYPGDLGGIAGADAKCQAAADAAKVAGTFRAWVSTATSSPATTFTRTSGDYVLADGTTVVAHGWEGLTSGNLLHAIDMTETKAAPPMTAPPCGATDANTSAWTATQLNGTPYTGFGQRNCKDWTSSSATDAATWGWPNATNGYWTQRCSSASGCDLAASLYCFQQ